MLNSDTKRHIDAARDVLVGVAPNPTTQIDQITYALIYKFMDDMDQASIKAGGEASFFVGDLEKYAWSNLMSTRMGNQEKMDLFSEALTKFSEAKQLPELFRTIFRAAFLPYRSPETLGLFLKEISYFDYTHPEELGNAYEYLLSIMSSQGDAGQFRTPRHIIDFIVDVINPTKDEKVLDPACGTGGFLVSTYNHILEQHDGREDPKKKEKPLTPDDRKKLMSNLQGYDIDPTMVRIAQVNMYLHQFKNPQIFQYDSLTSEERWSDKYDVILANPPFMSPKGGIKPHNKFGVASNRSEVLFVDYILSHLRPNGRAGIIVPEGVLFQGGNAYKELRKNLVDNGLYAVISLPAGVFQPYSGVKTSVLIINNEIAKSKSEIAFIKISADGFELGATKRVTTQNDLPNAVDLLRKWAADKSVEDEIISYVSKKEIQGKGEFNLSGERYKISIDHSLAKWPMARLGSLCNIVTGKRDANHGNPNGQYHFFTCAKENLYIDSFAFDTEALLIAGNGANVGQVVYFKGKFDAYQRTYVLSQFQNVTARYLFHLLSANLKPALDLLKQGNTTPYIKMEMLTDYLLPLPPVDVQELIVKDLDAFASIISGANQIIENWKPSIDVDPSWPRIIVSDLTSTIRPPAKIPLSEYSPNGRYPILDQSKKSIAGWTDNEKFVVDGRDGLVIFGDHTCSVKFSNEHFAQGADGIKILKANNLLNPKYLYFYLLSNPLQSEGYKRHFAKLSRLEIALPPLEIQSLIVESLEAEEEQISSIKKMVSLYQKRTQSVLSRLWNEPLGVE